MVYRFKVTYEDHEDVFRHIEIKASQSFLELHTAIQQAIGFDNSQPATFYTSDDYWRKGTIISIENNNDEKQKNKIKRIPQKAISAYIEEPHQRFIYVFDPKNDWTFLLELLTIIPENKTSSYPQCIKSVGAAPKQHKTTKAPPPIEEDNEKLDTDATTTINDKREELFILPDPTLLDETMTAISPMEEEVEEMEEFSADEFKGPDEDETENDSENNDDDTEAIDTDEEERTE